MSAPNRVAAALSSLAFIVMAYPLAAQEQPQGQSTPAAGARVSVGTLQMTGEGSPTAGMRLKVGTLSMIGEGSPTAGARVRVGTLQMIGEGSRTVGMRVRVGTLQMTGEDSHGPAASPPTARTPVQGPISRDVVQAPNAPRPNNRAITNRP